MYDDLFAGIHWRFLCFFATYVSFVRRVAGYFWVPLLVGEMKHPKTGFSQQGGFDDLKYRFYLYWGYGPKWSKKWQLDSKDVNKRFKGSSKFECRRIWARSARRSGVIDVDHTFHTHDLGLLRLAVMSHDLGLLNLTVMSHGIVMLIRNDKAQLAPKDRYAYP